MRQLLLSANHMSELSRNIGNAMMQVMELDCDDTEVCDLPVSIARCSNLTRLRMNNCPLIWPLDNLVMQGPNYVLRYLADRESADVHAPPKRVSQDSPFVPTVLSTYHVSGLSRFYKEQLKETDKQFREQYDISIKNARQ